MASNKKPLKAFMRVDGQGRVIAGSNILRKDRPKVGNWIQLQVYECCDPDFPIPLGGGGTPDFVEQVLGVDNSPFVCEALGTAADFAILSDQAISNTGNTVITGDMGMHPGTSVTGFPPGVVNGEQHITDATALQAQIDATDGYNCLRALTTGTVIDGDIGGDTLTPGIYERASSLGITGTLTLDAQGDPDAVFIFKTGSTLITATSASVVLVNGAQPCNVYWLVGSSAILGTNTTMVGNIIALTSVTLVTGSSLTGRAIALNGDITLDNNQVIACECTANPCA